MGITNNEVQSSANKIFGNGGKAPSSTKVPTSTKAQVKTERIHFSIQQAIVEDLKKVAFMKKISINKLVNEVLNGYVGEQAQKEKIAKYDSF